MESSPVAWPAHRVCDTFSAFFKSKGHTFVSSSLVVPVDDPTLLFANAGMFLGTVDPLSSMGSIKRACNTQKCIRAGGKHNNLYDVDKDTYHHTFFEMLGNRSFGDYFKEGAIIWAWELLIEVYKLSKYRLYATYSGGDETLGLVEDIEAREIWRGLLPESHVLPFGCKEVVSLKNLLDTVVIPAAKKAEFRTRLGELQERIRTAQRTATGSNLQLALHGAVASADAAVAQSQPYCVLRIHVGFNTNALKEAVTLVMEKHKDLAVMTFSVDEQTNKVLVYAGVPDSAGKRGLVVLDWLRASLAPINGKGGGVKNGLAQGQGVYAAGIDQALAAAKTFATKIFGK